jgi:subtilisin family serine protease
MSAKGKLLAVLLSLAAGQAAASDFVLRGDGPRLTAATSSLPKVQSWMNPEIGDAWSQGYLGKGVTVTIVDDFRSGFGYIGNLGTGQKVWRHGEWTREQVRMLAPQATVRSQDYTTGRAVRLNTGLNVLNLSYGMFARAGYSVSQIGWSAQESSIISYARGGRAVISKAAGNDGVAVGAATSAGTQDYLNSALIGAQSAIFVGALDRNGTADRQASLAWYSNFAGSNTEVQNQFLVVGVEGNKTGLYGTSFAAPVISGYSAVLGSKFTKATPTQITNQLLSTARIDTIRGYAPALHGRGEASIARALAPQAIR